MGLKETGYEIVYWIQLTQEISSDMLCECDNDHLASIGWGLLNFLNSYVCLKDSGPQNRLV
jgi:hypothetical protein